MKRFRTTTIGSWFLPEKVNPGDPDRLGELLTNYDAGGKVDSALIRLLSEEAQRAYVKLQLGLGLDLISNGELARTNFSASYRWLLEDEGFQGENSKWEPMDMVNHWDQTSRATPRYFEGYGLLKNPTCTGRIVLRSDAMEAVKWELDTLENILISEGLQASDGFVNQVSPGTFAHSEGVSDKNPYYKTREQYINALADAFRPRAKAILQRGFKLRIDAPHYAMDWHVLCKHMTSVKEYQKWQEESLAADLKLLDGFSPEQIQFHAGCWGNYNGVHDEDIPLEYILPTILQLPGELSLDLARAGRQGDWTEFRRKLPEGKRIIAGVIDVRSPMAPSVLEIALNLLSLEAVIGKGLVDASPSCGYRTFAKLDNIAPSAAIKQLERLVKGANLARMFPTVRALLKAKVEGKINDLLYYDLLESRANE